MDKLETINNSCVWYDMTWYDMIWYDMIWFMIWYGTRATLKLCKTRIRIKCAIGTLPYVLQRFVGDTSKTNHHLLNEQPRVLIATYCEVGKRTARLCTTVRACTASTCCEVRGPTQSVLRIFARNFGQTCPRAPRSRSFRKKKGKKRLTIIVLLQGLWLVGTNFRR